MKLQNHGGIKLSEKFIYPTIIRECPFCGGKGKKEIRQDGRFIKVPIVQHRRSSELYHVEKFNPKTGRVENGKPYRKMLYECGNCHIRW